MGNRKILLWLLIILISTSLMACRRKASLVNEEMEIIRSDEYDFEIIEEDGMRKTVLYFRDKQGLLVPVMRQIPWEEGIARSALYNMIDSPELRESLKDTGLSPVIPVGTEIRGMTIDEETGICKIDFTENILNYETEKEEENLIKGIVYTLTEFPSINQVEFLVNGEATNFKYNTVGIGPYKRENINLVGEEDSNSQVVVYYKGNHFEEDYEYFVPITIPTLAPVPNIYTALEVLFDGPAQELGLSSNIPEGASFHGVDIKDGIAYVDISFDYGEPPRDSEVFSNMITNIGLTLSEFEELEKVELLIDGQSLTEIGMDIYLNKSIPTFANEY